MIFIHNNEQKKQEIISSSFSLDKKTFDILCDFAKKKSLTRSSVIRLLILENLDKKLKIIN